jgi:chemotaxis regulatin CheY-phosphate phosphatase CheZ
MLDQDEINALMNQSDTPKDTSKSQDEPLADDIEDLVVEDNVLEDEKNNNIESGSQTWVEQKIEKAHLPYPVEPEHRVVNQLAQVTQDGEQKASEVFDSISDACDKLSHIDTTLGALSVQCANMEKFINVLQNKYPSIDIFTQKSSEIQSMLLEINSLKDDSSIATNNLYKAMETMQYQDISRQKIERVISVVRKLSDYLNNVFDVDAAREDIKVARHIHGDDYTEELMTNENDINDLIKEFGIDK